MECLPEVLPLKHNRKWDKERVIEYIQRRQQEGKAMNYATLRGDDYALLGAAERYFDSMKERPSWWYVRCSRCSTHQDHEQEDQVCYTLPSTNTASS
jgi:hypothetical protein